jgi:hypothetical protein
MSLSDGIVLNNKLETKSRKRAWPNTKYDPEVYLDGFRNSTEYFLGYSLFSSRF